MKATLKNLHRNTAKLVRLVVHDGQTLLLTERGKHCAKIIPIAKLNRKKAFEMLRAIGPVDLPSRK